jgi:hypothetical protein
MARWVCGYYNLFAGPPMIPYTLSGLRIDLALDKTIDTSRSVALFTIWPQLDSTKRRNQPSNGSLCETDLCWCSASFERIGGAASCRFC